MITWFLNLIQGDFASNPTAWIDLFITIAGVIAAPVTWLINSRKAKKDAETAQGNFSTQLDAIKGQRDEARRQAESQKQLADSLKTQIDLLERQVKALETQASLAERENAVPRWDIMQAKSRSIRYIVENLNAFDAYDVRVKLDNGKEYKLGDISAGSSVQFDFMEMSMWQLVQNDVDIEWSDEPNGERHTLHKALPARY